MQEDNTAHSQPSRSTPFGTRVLFISILGLLFYQIFWGTPSSLKPGALAPPLTLLRLDGEKTQHLAWKNQPTVLHFWATWCSSCVRGLSYSSHRALRLNRQKNVRYLLINIDEQMTGPRLRQFLRQQKIPQRQWTSYYLDSMQRGSRRFGVRVLPSLVILDRQGKLAHFIKGNLPTSQLVGLLQRLEKKMPPQSKQGV